MYYYVFSSLIFKDGGIRDAFTTPYRSEKPSTIVEFKNYVADNVAGPPHSYSAIVILHWEKIDEGTYNHITASLQAKNQQLKVIWANSLIFTHAHCSHTLEHVEYGDDDIAMLKSASEYIGIRWDDLAKQFAHNES